TEVAEAAARIAESLRDGLFPPDPSSLRALQARVSNPVATAEERLSALQSLTNMHERTAIDGRTEDVVLAAIDIASQATTDSALRARVWRLMRGVDHVRLVQPLVDALRYDPDERVR